MDLSDEELGLISQLRSTAKTYSGYTPKHLVKGSLEHQRVVGELKEYFERLFKARYGKEVTIQASTIPGKLNFRSFECKDKIAELVEFQREGLTDKVVVFIGPTRTPYFFNRYLDGEITVVDHLGDR